MLKINRMNKFLTKCGNSGAAVAFAEMLVFQISIEIFMRTKGNECKRVVIYVITDKC